MSKNYERYPENSGVFRRILCTATGASRNPTAIARETTLESLAAERKFDLICDILSQPEMTEEWLWISSSTGNALHALCLYQPTKAVIEKVSSLLSATCALEVDEKGRTPLHYAVANHASPAVVRLLLGPEDSSAAGVKDSLSRYPLHYAVSGNISCNSKRGRKKGKDENVQTVQLLLEVYPAAVVGRDLQGNTPLDRALVAKNGDSRIVSNLQFASRIFNKRLPVWQEESLTASASEQSKEEDFFAPFTIRATYQDDDDLSSVGSHGMSIRYFAVPFGRQLSIVEHELVDI